MRKILFSLLIALLLIFTVFAIYKGAQIGNANIWGITQISEENEKIDNLNAQLGNLVKSTYPQAVGKLNSSTETLQATKKEYEEQAVLVKNSKYYRETENYKIEFLWTRIGNYAQDRKVDVDMSISTGSASGFYNLNISATGSYANVADFIYDIENDSRLGFKIENFSMTAAQGTTATSDDGSEVVTRSAGVTGKFACKEVQIDLKSLDNVSTSRQTSTTQDGNANTNNSTTNRITGNTTNRTNTSSTTNSTSTTNQTGTANSTSTNDSTDTENSTSGIFSAINPR